VASATNSISRITRVVLLAAEMCCSAGPLITDLLITLHPPGVR
jgi:hypothetical protein